MARQAGGLNARASEGHQQLHCAPGRRYDAHLLVRVEGVATAQKVTLGRRNFTPAITKPSPQKIKTADWNSARSTAAIPGQRRFQIARR